MPRPQSRPTIPASFAAKKAEILSLLEQPEEAYADNSPKGTVDAQIRELIAEINAYDGLVTTSSCAGRVAVFVEGPKATAKAPVSAELPDLRSARGPIVGTTRNGEPGEVTISNPSAKPTGSPGGKGGGRWLYVSHDPVQLPNHSAEAIEGYFTELFHLSSQVDACLSLPLCPNPRLVHLSFSPLILHILCATLQHARPLLAAAINAGFRESGVQSLRIMDDPEHGVMVAVRTAGLAFETVVGVVGVAADNDVDGDEEQPIHRIVNEDYLGLCAGVVNERFRWNTDRRERFRAELRRGMEREGLAATADPNRDSLDSRPGSNGWEDKDERRRRKREEGLQRQQKEKEKMAVSSSKTNNNSPSHGQAESARDELVGGLATLGLD